MRLYGKNPVIERLKSNPKSIRKITIQEGHPDAAYIHKKARQWGLPVAVVNKNKMQKLARHANMQGVSADVDDFQYLGYGEMLTWARKKKACLIFLDELSDPQNLGSIIRSLACLGDFGVVITTHKSVQVTETVLRVSCGGENFVQVARVSNLAQAIKQAKDDGFWIAGTVVEGGDPLTAAVFPPLSGIIIGSEQKGVRPVLRDLVDQGVSIPMARQRMSFNVSQAATIFAYELIRQRSGSGKA